MKRLSRAIFLWAFMNKNQVFLALFSMWLS